MNQFVRRFLALSPAYPAVLLLFGMILSFAVVNLIGAPWHSGITIGLYSSALAWSCLLTWTRRHELPRPNMFDLLLAAFALFVLASILRHGTLSDLLDGHSRYLPFLLLAPYLCGRLMRREDIDLFAGLLAYVGLAFMPLLLWDAYSSPSPELRHPFFGVNHSPLLVGCLFAFALLSVGTRDDTRSRFGPEAWQTPMQYAWMALLAGFMVWVSARGWTIGAVFGFLALLAGALINHNMRRTYFLRLAFVMLIIWLSLSLLPDTHYFYSRLSFEPTRYSGQSEYGPILGIESCRPIEEGVDSVAIRWVLYQEAIAQFILSPLTGNGAGHFGDRSCLGPGGHPHSTILQGLSELGIIGGGILITLFGLAAYVLFRTIAREKNLASNSYLLLSLAFLATFLIADQIYGNYFMASGSYFTLGIVAALHGRTMPPDRRGA